MGEKDRVKRRCKNKFFLTVQAAARFRRFAGNARENEQSAISSQQSARQNKRINQHSIKETPPQR
jgi:hypothetical protein